jgi:hypothetical protein
MRTHFTNPAGLLTATMAVCGLGVSAAHAQTADGQLNMFMSTVRPAAAHADTTPALEPATSAAAATGAATPNTLSLGQLEMGLKTLPLTKLGHGSGPSLKGGAASTSNPSPSIHGFCYEACATARAFGSCGTSFPSWEPPPSQSCNPVIDTSLMESMIGPQLGVGDSPFVDYQTGPDGAQPAGYTFFGQFIDHDVTRTQADMSAAEDLLAQAQADPTVQAQLSAAGISTDLLKQALADASSPTAPMSVNTSKLDLDSVYGVTNYAALTQINAPWFQQQDGQYTGRFALRHVLAPTSAAAPLQIDGFDYERLTDGSAEIPDPRNSEHKILSQVQALFELAHNDCMDRTLAETFYPNQRDIEFAFDACHNKVKWTYETIVATDFLPRISAEEALSRIAPHALHHYDRGTVPTSVLPRAGEVHTFVYQCKAGSGSNAVIRIPHEFAVAAFRLGHSLVRDDYVLHQQVLDAGDDVLTGSPRPIFAEGTQAATVGLLGDNPLQPQDVIDWSYFFDTAPGTAQPSRPLDTLVSDKLFSLPVHALPPGNGAGGRDTPSERNLARRNILRASTATDMLSGAVGLGTGEAEMAYALVRIPGMSDTRNTIHQVMGQRLTASGFAPDSFAGRTPLWLYVLAEAEAMQDSKNLGEMGSHIVDEFLLGGLQCDEDSVLHAKPKHMKGWGPTETILAQHRYSLPDLINYVSSHATVNGQSIRITSRSQTATRD